MSKLLTLGILTVLVSSLLVVGVAAANSIINDGGSGYASDIDSPVSFSLTNDFLIGGLQFDLTYNSSVLTYASSQTTARTTGANVAENLVSPGNLRLSILGNITAGSGPALNLLFNVTGNATPGIYSMTISGSVVGDEKGIALAHTVADGSYEILQFCVDSDGDGYAINGGSCGPIDCNDANVAVNPLASEACNLVDDNCDGNVDEGVQNTYYQDLDTDGYGNAAESVLACVVPAGYVEDATDCNDANVAVNPLASEACDGADNDCNAGTADGSGELWINGPTTCGFGECSGNTGSLICQNGVQVDTCDPTAGAVPESCGLETGYDGLDNNCDGTIDLYCTSICDVDGDTYYSTQLTIFQKAYCLIQGYNAGDCDDTNTGINPAAADAVCNGVDDNCNGLLDDEYVQDTSCFLPGVCAAGNAASSCVVGVKTACQTGTPTVEICNGIDDDCNGLIPVNETDADGDGFMVCAGDCDDVESVINSNATEVCEGIDNNCNAVVDEGCPTCVAEDEKQKKHFKTTKGTARTDDASVLTVRGLGYDDYKGNSDDNVYVIVVGGARYNIKTDTIPAGLLITGMEIESRELVPLVSSTIKKNSVKVKHVLKEKDGDNLFDYGGRYFSFWDPFLSWIYTWDTATVDNSGDPDYAGFASLGITTDDEIRVHLDLKPIECKDEYDDDEDDDGLPDYLDDDDDDDGISDEQDAYPHDYDNDGKDDKDDDDDDNDGKKDNKDKHKRNKYKK